VVTDFRCLVRGAVRGEFAIDTSYFAVDVRPSWTSSERAVDSGTELNEPFRLCREGTPDAVASARGAALVRGARRTMQDPQEQAICADGGGESGLLTPTYESAGSHRTGGTHG